MNRQPEIRFWLTWGLLFAGLLLWSRCDTVMPEESDVLVVEAFVDAGEMLPSVRLWQTHPLDQPYFFDGTTAVPDAEVALVLEGERVAYEPVPGQAGHYRPTGASRRVPSRASLAFEATWREQQARAESVVPPEVTLDSVRIEVPNEPVDGIILDSLFIDPALVDSLQFDSLRTGVEQGLVYLVEVTLWWTVDFAEVNADSVYWIRTQLKPYLSDRPTFDDFFFRPEQIARERTLVRGATRQHAWTGVYAVPVEQRETPLPPHDLRVALIRSGQDYASYAASRTDPERREPSSNVQGALGIVAGLSLDSLRIRVE
ncbi:MAG TPA: hypothetical protein VKP65_08220 [Rhodothermales bacterium]|nr:hypothetical protein [Rhodothermales bacterium]